MSHVIHPGAAPFYCCTHTTHTMAVGRLLSPSALEPVGTPHQTSEQVMYTRACAHLLVRQKYCFHAIASPFHFGLNRPSKTRYCSSSSGAKFHRIVRALIVCVCVCLHDSEFPYRQRRRRCPVRVNTGAFAYMCTLAVIGSTLTLILYAISLSPENAVRHTCVPNDGDYREC